MNPTSPTNPTPASAGRWVDICAYDQLEPERGVCALVAGRQVAVFRSHDGSLYALSNYDPYGRAYVLSRGIVGDRAGVPVVSSPMHKHVFDLRTGECLDPGGDGTSDTKVSAYPVRCRAGRVEVAPA